MKCHEPTQNCLKQCIGEWLKCGNKGPELEMQTNFMNNLEAIEVENAPLLIKLWASDAGRYPLVTTAKRWYMS